MMMSKERRGLTRTMIGKAIELRNSIPWANPSQIMLLDDPRRPGAKKVRPAARNVIIAILSVAVVGETVYLLRRQTPEVFEVVAAAPEARPLVPGENTRAPAPSKPTPAAAPEAKAEAPPPPPPKQTEPVPQPAPVKSPAAAKPPSAAPPPAKAAVAPAQPAGKPANGNGTLVVVTRHAGKPLNGAIVRINGVSLGPTPVNATVIPGVYTVKVDLAGFKVEKRPGVEVWSSKKVVVTVDLSK
jgi:hypothetical protein